MKTNYAYITLLSTIDYLEAVLVLNRSLRQSKNKYPLVVACTPNVLIQPILNIFSTEQIKYEVVDWYEYTELTKQKLSGYHLQFVFNVGSKLKIFDLKQYDKLVYLDADALVVKKIDQLFARKDGSTLAYLNYGKICCFCAMFVFKPDNHSTAIYEALMNTFHMNDGSVMEKTWTHIRENKSYIIPNRYFYSNWHEKLYMPVRVYHLQNPQLKYWLHKTRKNTPLANLYYSYLDPIREQYKNELDGIRNWPQTSH